MRGSGERDRKLIVEEGDGHGEYEIRATQESSLSKRIAGPAKAGAGALMIGGVAHLGASAGIATFPVLGGALTLLAAGWAAIRRRT